MTLKEYVDLLFKAHEKEHDLLKLALEKANDILEIRLHTMNEFREQLGRQEQSFATKEMLKPYDEFRNKFIGMMLGVTALNGVLTYVIIKVIAK